MSGKLTVRQKNGSTVLPFSGTPTVSEVLREGGISHRADCGGRGVCGKCLVSASGALSLPDTEEAKRITGTLRLACRARLLGDAEVTLPEAEITVISTTSSAQAQGTRSEGGYGIAVDLGTTTIAARLYDLGTGALLADSACPNPQSRFGADVMARITAAAEGQLPLLTSLARQAILSLADRVCEKGGIARRLLTRGTVVGNTTMLYLLCGYDPDVLGHTPFSPIADFSAGTEFGGIRFTLPQPIDAFVGSDTVAAILAAGLHRPGETALLCDVGTNGEIALRHGGRLYTSSCAAGPAFEGAGISCGCPALPGAVCRVWEEDGRVRFATVDGAPACGICGSGLLGAAAVFLARGEIDETGYIGEPLRIGSLSLIEADIRALQLAKAAIAGGIHTLCDTAGVKPGAIPRFLLAGGFGSGLDPKSAAGIGLFPPSLLDATEAVGNAALAGCAMILLSEEAEEEARSVVLGAIPCPLGGSAAFSDRFIGHISFDNDWD